MDPGLGMTESGNQASDLVAGELAPFAGLGSLSHLDFNFVAVDKVVGRYAEATGSHLLDP